MATKQKSDFPHVILDNGKIVSASMGKEYNTHHVQFISSDPDEIFEIFCKVADACNEKYQTKKCPDCDGRGDTEESRKAGQNCFTCNGKMIVVK